MGVKIELGILILILVLWFCGGGMTRNDTETSFMSNIVLIICFAYLLIINIKYFCNKINKK